MTNGTHHASGSIKAANEAGLRDHLWLRLSIHSNRVDVGDWRHVDIANRRTASNPFTMGFAEEFHGNQK